ncbi:MAG TPA: hypothetical protein VGE11_10945 [Pseudonocardia sp.]
MTVTQSVLFLVVTPVVLYVLIALLAAAPRLGHRPRYRVGQPWTFAPLWWTANPRGAQLPPLAEHLVSGGKGGARGTW